MLYGAEVALRSQINTQRISTVLTKGTVVEC